MWWHPMQICLEERRHRIPEVHTQKASTHTNWCVCVCVAEGHVLRPSRALTRPWDSPGQVLGRQGLGAGPASWFQGVQEEVMSQVSHL